ncbi:MAG: hypothetical protein EBS09_11975, partial [Flavobacteriia bacterium]|nr:hypothetical protein [Flavobacteriia bacterium]
AHQAWVNNDQLDTGGYTDLQKFAELIIKNCGYYADIFAAIGCPADMDPTETKPSDYIKKHFGLNRE